MTATLTSTAVIDATSVELQGRLWHGGVVETPYELQRWEWTGVAAVDMPEARPGRNCRSRAVSVQVTQPVNKSSRRWRNDEGDEAGEYEFDGHLHEGLMIVFIHQQLVAKINTN